MNDNEGVRPGWYPDPGAPGTQRYWDGEQWVGESLPEGAAVPDGPLVARREPEPAPPPAASVPPPPAPIGSPQGVPPPDMPGAAAPPWGSGVGGVPTPHGLPLASLGSRFVARLLDIGAVFVLNVIANGWFMYQFVQEVVPYWQAVVAWSMSGSQEEPPQLPERAGNLVLVMLLVLIAVWGAYEIPATAGTGQTVGKRLLGIKVVRLDEPEAVGVGRSVRRWANMALPVLLWQCGIGFVLQFIDAVACVISRPYQQCIHDKGVHTVVVSVRGAPGRAASSDGSAAPDSGEGEAQ